MVMGGPTAAEWHEISAYFMLSMLFRAICTSLLAWTAWTVAKGFYNIYLHPLAGYPGPKLAGFTILWKMYVELIEERNLVDCLFELHTEYG